jgi:regulator of protease activity HflC (stomatin/prohibitin superfamily)
VANYTITLSDEQEVALQYALELRNVERQANDEEEMTLEEILQERNGSDMANTLRNLDTLVTPILSNLRLLDATTLAAVLATEPSQAVKDRIQQLI